MANKYLDLTGLGYFWEKVDAAKVDKVSGKGLSTNDYTTTEKNKLAGIASGAEVNQNAFSNVKVGSTTIAADSKTDTLTITAGSNITLTPDASGDSFTIAATDTTYSLVGANGTTGLIKNGSDVTSTSGLVAAPIISGVPYYKNTTYSSMSASELSTGTATTGRLMTASVLSSYINSKIAAADAMIFKGTIGTGGTVTELPATHTCGWTYKVATAGTYAGVVCEVGDMIICLADGTAAADADWTVVQTNIDGAVTGPASATSGRIAVFDGTTGKVIKDSGYTIATSVPSGAKFTDTTYTAGTGISISSNKITNAGVRSIATGGTNGTISVNTNGTSAEVAVKGLGSAAYTNSSAYATSGHTHSYAGSSSAGGAATSANKVNSALTLKIKSGTTEGTDLYTFDGSAAKALDIVAGSNVTLTAASGKLTIAATDTKYTHPTYTSKSSGLYKITVDGTGHVSAATAVAKSDITALGIPSSNTTYSVAVNGTAGLIKPWYNHTAASTGPTAGSDATAVTVNAITSTASRYYALEMDSNGRGFVNVPWTNTTYSSLKNPNALTVQYNGTSSYTYDGSAAKTLNIKAGSNVTVSGDTSGNITIAATNTTYSAATTSKAGLMSATDKTNLDNCVTVCASAATTAITNDEIDTIIAGA